MYKNFYGFTEKPFEITPDPGFFFSSDKHREALAHLQYAIKEGKGFTVITGEAGSGKTTIVRTLLSKLSGNIRTAYIFNPMMDHTEFLHYICEDLGVETDKQNGQAQLAQLHRFLLECYERNERVFLIIDEAQTLSRQLLHQVRLLTNLETSKSKLLHVMLIGQPELDKILEEAEFRPLKQRISVRYYLPPLNGKEIADYIVYRLKRAGARNLRIFHPEAVRAIAQYSKGIPRLINTICDNALLSGFSTNKGFIGPELIHEVARDLKLTGRKKFFKWSYTWAAIIMSVSVLLVVLASVLLEPELSGLYRIMTGWL